MITRDEIIAITIDLICQHGDLIKDSRRLRAFLLDLAPNNRLEINLLVQAVDYKIVDAILRSGIPMTCDLYSTRFSQRLIEDYGISESNAIWVVRAWSNILIQANHIRRDHNADQLYNLWHKRPGGDIAKRQLQVILICNVSISMQGAKIAVLNMFIRELLEDLHKETIDNPYIDIYINCLQFSIGTRWNTPYPIPLKQFTWTDLIADQNQAVPEGTAMGTAMYKLAEVLVSPSPDYRYFPPVLILFSDTYPNDDVIGGINALLAQPLGKSSVRIACSIGIDTDLDSLKHFAGPHGVISPRSSSEVIRYIKWAS